MPVSLDALPTEIIFHIFNHVDNLRDKCQLFATCHRFHNLLRSHPGFWSPLDLSPFSDHITNFRLLTILRNCSVPIILPAEAKYASLTTQTRHEINALQHVNLSGCWGLTSDAICMVAHSLPHMTELHLNRYRSTPWASPFEQRDYLYQIRPLHNLSSLAMDLSKEPTLCLMIPEITLNTVVQKCLWLEALSLQHQCIGLETSRAMGQLRHLSRLDISSCIISQPSLQVLFRNVGRQLVSLKMLNIDITNLTLLCMQQYLSNLTCLHLSCTEPQMLPGIALVLGSFTRLADLRLTCLRLGDVDVIVEKLNSNTMQRLDISPKMDFHPHYPRSFPSLIQTYGAHPTQGRVHPPSQQQQHPQHPNGWRNRRSVTVATGHGVHAGPSQGGRTGRLRGAPNTAERRVQQQPISYLSRTEHELNLTDQALLRLSTFQGLVELRLCYPTISAQTLTAVLKATPLLAVFELRISNQRDVIDASLQRGAQIDPNQVPDYLQALAPAYKPRLRELHVYHVWISDRVASTLAELKTLQYVTLYNGGNVTETRPECIRRCLLSLPRLRMIRLGKMPLRWDYLSDIATMTDAPNESFLFRVGQALDSPYALSRITAEGEIMFERRGDEWRWNCT